MAMYLQLGIRHQPFGSELGQSRAQAFVAGAGLAYKLTENTSLQLEFRQAPSSYYMYSPYSSPFSRTGFGARRSFFDDEPGQSLKP